MNEVTNDFGLVLEAIAVSFPDKINPCGGIGVHGRIEEFAKFLLPQYEGIDLGYLFADAEMLVPVKNGFSGLMHALIRAPDYTRYKQLKSGLIVPQHIAEASGLNYGPVQTSSTICIEPIRFLKNRMQFELLFRP